MGHQAAKTACNIDNTFGLGTANSVLVAQEVLQRRREPWRWAAQWPVMGCWQWPTETIMEAHHPTTTGEVAEELNVNHSMVIQHVKQTGKVKKLDKWVPHELTKNKKHHHFEVSSPLIVATTNHFLIRLWFDEQCILHSNWWQLAQWLDREEAPKHFSKPNLNQKNDHGRC